jgi:hypothetical protein
MSFESLVGVVFIGAALPLNCQPNSFIIQHDGIDATVRK